MILSFSCTSVGCCAPFGYASSLTWFVLIAELNIFLSQFSIRCSWTGMRYYANSHHILRNTISWANWKLALNLGSKSLRETQLSLSLLSTLFSPRSPLFFSVHSGLVQSPENAQEWMHLVSSTLMYNCTYLFYYQCIVNAVNCWTVCTFLFCSVVLTFIHHNGCWAVILERPQFLHPWASICSVQYQWLPWNSVSWSVGWDKISVQ